MVEYKKHPCYKTEDVVGSGRLTVLVGHLTCTLNEPCTAHVTHNTNKKSSFLFECTIQVDSAAPFLPPACDSPSTPGLVPCLVAPPTPALSRILAWLSSALG